MYWKCIWFSYRHLHNAYQQDRYSVGPLIYCLRDILPTNLKKDERGRMSFPGCWKIDLCIMCYIFGITPAHIDPTDISGVLLEARYAKSWLCFKVLFDRLFEMIHEAFVTSNFAPIWTRYRSWFFSISRYGLSPLECSFVTRNCKKPFSLLAVVRHQERLFTAPGTRNLFRDNTSDFFWFVQTT